MFRITGYIFFSLEIALIAAGNLHAASWTSLATPDRLHVNPSGTMVGIGTTSPGASLHVSGAGVGSGLSGVDLTNTVTNGRTFKLSSGIRNVSEAGFTIMDRTAGDAHRMVIDAGGNVGIGTTTPQARLDVKGGVRLTDGVNGTLSLFGDSEGAVLVVGKLQGGNRDFRIEDAHNGELLRVTSSGDAKVKGRLDVAGINTKTWTMAPDYVFEKDYKLRPLDEVDAFVKKNKHLPEVPSAKDFKEKGMDLAEMNFVLLKKVEELTLHAIRQEKEMKRQAQEIADLKRMPR